MKRFLIGVGIVLTLASISFAKPMSEMTEEIWTEYRTLMGTSSYRTRLNSATELTKIYKKSENFAALAVAMHLLKVRYDYYPFNEGKDEMFYDDMVAEVLVDLLSSSKQPFIFETLMWVVVKRNHRSATIKAAWEGLQAIDWTIDIEEAEELLESVEDDL